MATAAAKTQAANICENSPSAREVFNYLTVNPYPALNTNSSITSDAKNRLDKQNDLNSDLIKVVTVDDVVYIMGSNVGNLNSLKKAINGIYSIDNVQKVVNLEQVGCVIMLLIRTDNNKARIQNRRQALGSSFTLIYF